MKKVIISDETPDSIASFVKLSLLDQKAIPFKKEIRNSGIAVANCTKTRKIRIIMSDERCITHHYSEVPTKVLKEINELNLKLFTEQRKSENDNQVQPWNYGLFTFA